MVDCAEKCSLARICHITVCSRAGLAPEVLDWMANVIIAKWLHDMLPSACPKEWAYWMRWFVFRRVVQYAEVADQSVLYEVRLVCWLIGGRIDDPAG